MTGIDTYFAQNAQQALAAGLELGFYHTFNADVLGAVQARNFLTQAARFPHPLGLWLDVEHVDGITDPPPDVLADRIQAFVGSVEKAGERIGIYTGGYWGQVGRQNDRYFGTLPLWVAHYNSHVTKPDLPHGWNDYYLWQFTSSGHIEGIDTRVDLSRFKDS